MCGGSEDEDDEEAVVAEVAEENEDGDEDENGVHGGGAVLKIQREEDRKGKKMGDQRKQARTLIQRFRAFPQER
jgi:hypothetical protein